MLSFLVRRAAPLSCTSSSLRFLSTVQTPPLVLLRQGGGGGSNSITGSRFGGGGGAAAAAAAAARILRAQQQPLVQQQRQCMRFYRGGVGDSPPKDLSMREEALLQVAKPKAAVILAQHHRLPNLSEIPKDSLMNNTNDDSDPSSSARLDTIRRKRLIYRSKQRGWLEVDLLLGTWASENVMQLNDTELDEFEDFVNMETIDIYNIITLRTQPEPDASNKKIVERIQTWARGNPLGKADPDMYRTVKASAKLI
jgi:succinate dehydrogenase assembly factor 2